jgi:hypothetical protein
MDWKQLGTVSMAGLAAVGLWYAGTRLGAPTEITSPAAIALATAVVGYMKSYKAGPL